MVDCGFIVSTRFGIGVTDPEWFEFRFSLFESITLPSLTAQSDQDFLWLLFVGQNPLPWVVDRLSAALQPFGQRARLIYDTQNPSAINTHGKHSFGGGHCVLALIDDDDAWHRNLIRYVKAAASEFLSDGLDRCCYTYPEGYEWLVTDIVDVDAFNKSGRVVNRKSACYPYRRPFHSMSCFTLSPTGHCFEGFGSLHSSLGGIARKYGYTLRELVYPEGKAWLYARHQQADSAIHKAWANSPASVSVEDLVNRFGIDAARLEAFREKAHCMPYAVKRSHKLQDKSRLTFRIDQLINKQ
jgi:hypothetical protein